MVISTRENDFNDVSSLTNVIHKHSNFVVYLKFCCPLMLNKMRDNITNKRLYWISFFLTSTPATSRVKMFACTNFARRKRRGRVEPRRLFLKKWRGRFQWERSFPCAQNRSFGAFYSQHRLIAANFSLLDDMTPPKPALYTASVRQIDRDIDAGKLWKDSMGRERANNGQWANAKKKGQKWRTAAADPLLI